MSKKKGDPRGQLEMIPPVRSFLECGIPCLAALDTYVDDLDRQLEDNSKQLDSCLQDILRSTNSLPGNKDWSSPQDAISHMLNTNMLEKDSCYDPEPDDINTILNHIAGTLEQHPGCEESVLQELLKLSSQEGLSLPQTNRSRSMDHLASMASLNTVDDSVEVMISQQWDHIALRLWKYFTDRLSKLPIDSQKQTMDLYENKRFAYIQSLCGLYPSDSVLLKYQTLRSQQLDHCFHTLLPDADSDNYNSIEVTRNCRELADIILKMIDEDFVIFNSSVFKKSFNIARAMHDMYLEKFSDEMSALVEDIWEDCEEIMKKRKSSFSSNSGSQSGLNKSLKKKTSSLESMVANEIALEPTAFCMPRECIESILNVVMAVLHIEEHVESLLKCAAWDNAGLSNKKIKRKGSLRGVLKTSSSPETPRRPMSYGGPDDKDVSFDESVSSFNSSLTALSDNTPAPKVVERARAEERLRWEWKLMFKKISHDLAECVAKQIRNLLKTSIDKELKGWTEQHILVTEPVPEELWGGKLDYPKAITKSVMDFMNELDFLLPFARAGIDGVLHCVKTSFIDSVNLCLQNFHVHITKLSGDIPKNAPMKSLYAILSSAAYIRNHLHHYECVLTAEESSKKVFSVLFKQYEELVEALTKLMMEIHNNFMATSILHDTESNNWADTKEFHEGERCSFPIQMWNYHIRGLKHDLWTIGPPRLGQKIYGRVLHESLHILTKRYAQIKPSYRRTPQYRNDVLTILLCTAELMLPSCTSVSMYLDVGISQLPHYTIHNLCATLMASLAVIASPIDILYRIFKRGFYLNDGRQEMISPVEDLVGCNTDWLSWMQPTIFKAGHKHFDDLQTTVAIYIQIKLMLSQPEVDWAMIVQAMVMKDFTLPILFLTQSILNDNTTQNSPQKENTQPSKASPLVRDVFTSIISMLSKCSHFPDAVSKVLVPVIERCDHWVYMETKAVPGKDFQIPVWMMTVFDLMEPFCLRVIKPILENVVMMGENSRQQIWPVMSVLNELPCGCPPHQPPPAKPKKSDATKEFIDTSLRKMVYQMADDIYVLPSSVCMLLKIVQENCHSKNIKTPHKCAALKVIASCLRYKLCDSDYLERITGVRLSQKDKDLLELLADSIYSVIVYTKAKSTGTPKLANRFCKENKEWILQKLQFIGGYIGSEIFDVRDCVLMEESTNEFMAQLFKLIASNILDTKTGREDLTKIHNLIANNMRWLEHHLDICLVLPSSDRSAVPLFTTCMDTPKPSEFDPTKEFDLIGTCKFDHDAIDKFPIDWCHLLQSDLGLSEFGFRSLLYNRHEMQEGVFLEESEKKPVEVLKAVYENEARELG